MDDSTRARALSALERYRDGPPAHPRSYPDLHEHVLALARAGLLIVVDEPINKDTEMHPLVRWQYRGGIAEATNQAFRDSGLFHILSISGLHMVIMAGAVFFCRIQNSANSAHFRHFCRCYHPIHHPTGPRADYAFAPAARRRSAYWRTAAAPRRDRRPRLVMTRCPAATAL